MNKQWFLYTWCMHIYFSGIGGTAIGPLALIAKEAGLTVSGSDKQESDYIDYLRDRGVSSIATVQDGSHLAEIHANNPIDWFVYSSAVAIENPDSPELAFCREHGIKATKRDELLNHIISHKKLKLLAVAGTHGKTTTTAMLVWLLKQLSTPVSYSVGAKISFGDMGEYNPDAQYFVYECDEFDRNFLAFNPYMSLITGIDWDHPDIFETRDAYEEAFQQFAGQSQQIVCWQRDSHKMGLPDSPEKELSNSYTILNDRDPVLDQITLKGLVNRQNAWQVIQAVHTLSDTPLDTLISHMNRFPGLSRRFEELIPNLYTDYAHTPPKIRGALQTATELAGKPVVVVYEGLHNTRQHFIKEDLVHLFDDVEQLYVVPSYLAREDPNLALLSPQDIVNLVSKPAVAKASQLNNDLKKAITQHLSDGELVLCLTAGGGGSFDEWLRNQFH